MGALVGYASSEDEEEETEETPQETKSQTQNEALGPVPQTTTTSSTEPAQARANEPEPALRPVPDNAVPLGPSLPPLDSTTNELDEQDPSRAPSSPYSAKRTLIHDLTLPSIPNLDIPPSPPGSPPPATNKKFSQFLELKKKGTHFNSKLDQSAALKNPSLTDKLLGFVEADGPAQYETTLPADLWNPTAFPQWAFREELKKTRERVAKEREADRTGGSRAAVDFVPATTPGTAGKGTGAGLSKGEKKRSEWK